MKRTYLLITLVVLGAASLMAQRDDNIAEGLASVATVAGETEVVYSTQDSTAAAPIVEMPVWKKKLYYGYNFDIYYHNNSRPDSKENGWSFTVEPEVGWRLKEKVYLGLRLGGNYQDTYTTYTTETLLSGTESQNMRVRQGSWSATPYMRYRLKTLFNDKVGIWLEAHLHTGMEFPSVVSGSVNNTEYDGLKYKVVYGVQISPVITYQFNKKSTFQIFFSILSAGYSGTAYCYKDHRNEYTNDVIIFSGKLKNLLTAQFTPGMYGLKFGVQKSF